MKKKEILIDCIEWDTENWSKALTFWESKVDLNNKNFKCLELGGRRGGISLWLALKGNTAICSDLQNPRDEAIKVHRKYGVESDVYYEAINATNIPYVDHFDIVAFKSILGGISRNNNYHLNQVVIDQVYKALKPGGKLLFAENLIASSIHRFFRKKLTRWGAYWNYLDFNNVPHLLEKFEVSLDTAGFLGAFGRTEAQRQFLGKIDTVWMDKLVGPRLKYIVFGVATKPFRNHEKSIPNSEG